MATVAERLLQLKEEIEHGKLDKASAEGALKQNLVRLKDEFGCRSVDQAVAKLEKLKEQKESLTEQIETAMTKLEADFSW